MAITNDLDIQIAMESAVAGVSAVASNGYAAGDLIPLFRPNAQTGRDELVGKIQRSVLMDCIKESLGTLLNSGGAQQESGITKVPTLVNNVLGGTSVAGLASALGVPATYEFIDMGLPSHTLWCTKNIGAEKETDNGLYFSWGNIDGHRPTGNSFSPYTWGTSNDEEPYTSSRGKTLTTDIPDNCDAAQRYIGGQAKMPTKEQFVELFNTEYIKYINASGSDISSQTDKRTTLNGVVGLYIESKINGKRLFFPAAGTGRGQSLYDAGSNGLFWSRSRSSDALGYRLSFNASGVYPSYSDNRYYGFSVRAVL